MIFRTFNVGDWKAALVYIDGMADKLLLDHYVLEPLMLCSKGIEKCRANKRQYTFSY